MFLKKNDFPHDWLHNRPPGHGQAQDQDDNNWKVIQLQFSSLAFFCFNFQVESGDWWVRVKENNIPPRDKVGEKEKRRV